MSKKTEAEERRERMADGDVVLAFPGTEEVNAADAFVQARDGLRKRAEWLRTELREAETLLGLRAEGADADDVKQPLRDSIQWKIHRYVSVMPGSQAPAIKKATRLGDIQVATALNAMTKKGMLRVAGRRGAYRYFPASWISSEIR